MAIETLDKTRETVCVPISISLVLVPFPGIEPQGMESCLHVLAADSSRQLGSQLCCLFSVDVTSCHVTSRDVTGLLRGRRREREGGNRMRKEGEKEGEDIQ